MKKSSIKSLLVSAGILTSPIAFGADNQPADFLVSCGYDFAVPKLALKINENGSILGKGAKKLSLPCETTMDYYGHTALYCKSKGLEVHGLNPSPILISSTFTITEAGDDIVIKTTEGGPFVIFKPNQGSTCELLPFRLSGGSANYC